MNLAQYPGLRLIQASWIGTGLFAATVLPAAAEVQALHTPGAVVSLVLFAVSIPLSLHALGRAAVRAAREEERISVAGLFLLSGSAPKPVKWLLNGSLLVSIAVCAIGAAREPFGILQPVFPMSLAAQWAARYGTFPKAAGPVTRPQPKKPDAPG